MLLKKIYIITTSGGIGNQMMNYCLWYYLKYKKRYKSILYPKIYQLNDHNGYEINKVFPNTKKPNETSWFIDNYIKLNLFVERIFNILSKRLKLNILNDIIQKFPVSVINFPCWKDYTFISEIKSEIINEFKVFLDEKNKLLVNQMRQEDSVCIHIRRGDYQNNTNWRMVLGDICDIKYYSDCIYTLSSIIETPKFYIFSDDINWAKDNLKLIDAVYVNWNNGNDSYKDLVLMSNCKVCIIANSTFSLMSAWLNVRDDATIIAPSKWRNYYNDNTYKKYIPSNWKIQDNNLPFICLIYKGNLNINEVRNIMKSSYTDFILNIQNFEDFNIISRIVSSNNCIARHYLELNSNEISKFTNRHFLTKRINEFFK